MCRNIFAGDNLPCIVRLFKCVPHPLRDASVVRSDKGDECEKDIYLHVLAGFFHHSKEFLILVGSDRDFFRLSLFDL